MCVWCPEQTCKLLQRDFKRDMEAVALIQKYTPLFMNCPYLENIHLVQVGQ
jgi:hypothetical protein